MKKISNIFLTIILSSCGTVEAASDCADIIADYDSKISRISNQSTQGDVVRLLGIPQAIYTGEPQEYYYLADGCKTYKILFSNNRVIEIR